MFLNGVAAVMAVRACRCKFVMNEILILQGSFLCYCPQKWIYIPHLLSPLSDPHLLLLISTFKTASSLIPRFSTDLIDCLIWGFLVLDQIVTGCLGS
ncbi:hypothetical protein IMY05_002G0002600 [Salix suchowensis]|nr:hypothetical protein IMY05_002G0002600 [Salix suchowensis]